MFYSLVDVISSVVIILCGISLGFIIGNAQERCRGRELALEEEFPSLRNPENAN